MVTALRSEKSVAFSAQSFSCCGLRSIAAVLSLLLTKPSLASELHPDEATSAFKIPV
jgi:hypothetical protein